MPGHGGGGAALPTVKFTVVEPTATVPPDVGNPQLATYGYNNGKEWSAYQDTVTHGDGGRYLRWLQPTEADLAKQVEYDMDEQDKLWLDMVNGERKRENHSAISYEVFEIVMDKIEKEWFDLTRNIPKRTNAMPNEDSKCAICDDGECENSNAIVFCDGCNLAVHQDCYGVPYIPEGQWLCRKCTVTPDKPVVCVLCPNSYGAFKQTTTGQWAHLLCAIWVPETGVVNTVYMEPVDGLEAIPKSRWKLLCYLCKKRVGACIQCANRSCYTAFHVTCAREYGLELKMKQGLAPGGDLKAYCDKHGEGSGASRGGSPLPSTLRRHKAGPSSSLLKLTLRLPNKGKSARAYKSTFNSGPPVIPAKIFDRVMAYIGKLKVNGKKDVVNLVCRYWSLKRESRRGAPLLKRIHLEPWTASATSRQQTEQDKAQKLGLIRLLRNDLEKVRMLTELVRKREKKKLERAKHLKAVVEELLFPKEASMRKVLQSVKSFDKTAYFSQPVNREDVPDYYEIIKFPMDWATMSTKLDRHEYPLALDFSDDIHLVINNARRYNKEGTPIHKAAVKLKEFVEPLLADLEALDERLSDPNILSHYVSQILTAEDLDDLFAFDYDTNDPEGKKAQAAERRTREAAEAEEAAAAEAAAAELVTTEQAQDDVEEEVKVGAKSKGKAKGKGKAKSRDEAKPEAELPDGMEIDVAPASAQSKKRNADEAGLDGTPRLRARATRSSGIAAVELPLPARDKPASARATPARDAAPVASTSRAPVASTSRASATPRSPMKPMPEILADEEIDPKATFQHFETGWILPAGSRRRSSVGTSASVSEPPRKTPRAEPATLVEVPEETATPGPVVSTSDKTPAPASKARAKSKGKGKMKAEPEPDEMQVDVEEAPANAAETPKPSHAKKPRASLASHAPAVLKEWEQRFHELSAEVMIAEKPEDGTLVWAQVNSYPYYPAELVDPKDKETPQWLIDAQTKGDVDKLPVLFFDGSRSGGWIARSSIRLLGENTDLDKHLLDPLAVRYIRKVKNDKNKNSKGGAEMVQRLVKAYDKAMSLAEDETDRAAAAEASQAKPAGKGRKKKAPRKSKGK